MKTWEPWFLNCVIRIQRTRCRVKLLICKIWMTRRRQAGTEVKKNKVEREHIHSGLSRFLEKWGDGCGWSGAVGAGGRLHSTEGCWESLLLMASNRWLPLIQNPNVTTSSTLGHSTWFWMSIHYLYLLIPGQGRVRCRGLSQHALGERQ